MSTSISDLTSYDPWFPQMPGDASDDGAPDTDDETGSSATISTGTPAGDSSAVLSHLTDVMQSILAQYQEAAGTKASTSAPAADPSAAAGTSNDEMLTELITDLNSELSTLESGRATDVAPGSAGTSTQGSTARLAEALSNMAMLMLQSYNADSPSAGASVSMTS